MVDQLNMVMHRDGQEAAVAYAKQTLAIYRECAKRRPTRPVHFAVQAALCKSDHVFA